LLPSISHHTVIVLKSDFQILPRVRLGGAAAAADRTAKGDDLCPRLLFLTLHAMLVSETDLDAFNKILSRLCLSIKVATLPALSSFSSVELIDSCSASPILSPLH
jgi:hypothetical protein